MNMQRVVALDDLSQHLYQYLPSSRPPHADQRLPFSGVAAEFGLGRFWQGGSKQPAIRSLLESVLDSGTGKFSALIAKIVERSNTYLKRSDSPVTRESVEQLNALVLKVGFRIPELHDPAFLDSLPLRERAGPRHRPGRPTRRL
jgi:hypothetical protein